jgi:2-oxoglutarate ferredoxin oxidoreductase subunit alpha
MNLGQLALLLRGKYLVDVVSYNQVRGLPFRAEELEEVLTNVIKQTGDTGTITGTADEIEVTR